MAQQFKVLTHTIPVKQAKKNIHPYEFERLVNEHLQQGWKVINCESTQSVHYWAYLVKD